jgi:hypothetical protein
MKYKVGDKVRFYYNGIVCNGIVMSADKEIYTVNFAYKESGKPPVDISYELTEIEILG